MKPRGFTQDVVEWESWLPLVDAATATPEQRAALAGLVPGYVPVQ